MSRVLLILLGLAVVLLSPTRAHAACGGSPATTVYETPEVKVANRHDRFTACLLPSGMERLVGHEWTFETDESFFVTHAVAGRYLHALHFIGDEGREATIEDQLTDLRTGARVSALLQGPEQGNMVAVVTGALVSAGAEGVVARHTDGRTEVLETAPASALATSGGRIYWQTAAGARTASVRLQDAAAERAPRRAYPVGRCVPGAGARLILNDDGVLVTRTGKTMSACRKGRTRQLGQVRDVEVFDRAVSYRRAGHVGILDIKTGARRELRGKGSAFADVLAAAGSTGVRVWPEGRAKPMVVTKGAGSQVAVAPGEGIVYWLDSAGRLKSRGVGSLVRPVAIPASTSAMPSA